jgi:hypothetical protein
MWKPNTGKNNGEMIIGILIIQGRITIANTGIQPSSPHIHTVLHYILTLAHTLLTSMGMLVYIASLKQLDKLIIIRSTSYTNCSLKSACMHILNLVDVHVHATTWEISWHFFNKEAKHHHSFSKKTGFVNMSAKFNFVWTFSKATLPSSTTCLTKCYLIEI